MHFFIYLFIYLFILFYFLDSLWTGSSAWAHQKCYAFGSQRSWDFSAVHRDYLSWLAWIACTPTSQVRQQRSSNDTTSIGPTLGRWSPTKERRLFWEKKKKKNESLLRDILTPHNVQKAGKNVHGFFCKRKTASENILTLFLFVALFFTVFLALLWLSDGNRTLVPQKCGHKVT